MFCCSLVAVTRPWTIVKNELPWRPDDVVGEPDLAPRQRLRACDLPDIMDEEEWFDAYRFALIQFVADWNRATHPASLIFDPPVYRGADWRLLPTIASVVHALAVRESLSVPEWVWEHRAPRDWVVFSDPPGSFFWNRDRERAPATCVNHRVYFHHRLLDKGTPDWWLPWD